MVSPFALQTLVGLATIYTPGDGHTGSIRADGRPFRRGDFHIAHRTLPLGTIGRLCLARTNRCVEVAVRDRGPWGEIIDCNRRRPSRARRITWQSKCWWWRASVKPSPGWRWRGEFDLTLPVARALKARAWDEVMWTSLNAVKSINLWTTKQNARLAYAFWYGRNSSISRRN